MINSEWMAVILAGASAIVLLSNAAEKLIKAFKAAKGPNDLQNARLDALEKEMSQVKGKLDRDKRHLDSIDAGNRVTQVALLALLDHGIDGNNTEQMRRAKEELQQHLISK